MTKPDAEAPLVPSNAVVDSTAPEVDPLSNGGRPRRPNFFLRIAQAYWNSCVCVMLTGSLIVATGSLCLRVLNRDYSFFQLSVGRVLISSPIFIPFSYYQTGYVFGPMESMGKVSARGILSGVGYVLMVSSFMLLPIADASLLGNTHPAFVAILAWAVGTQKMDTQTTVGVVGTLIAMVLVSKPPMLFGGGDEDDEMDFERIAGIVVSIAGSIVRSVGFIVIGKIDPNVPSIVIANHALFSVFVISFPFLFTSFPKKLKLDVSWLDVLMYLGISGASLNQILIVRGFQIGTPVTAGVLLLTRVLFSVFLGTVVLSEDFTWILALGTVLLVGSIGLVTIKGSAPKPDLESVLSGEDNPGRLRLESRVSVESE